MIKFINQVFSITFITASFATLLNNPALYEVVDQVIYLEPEIYHYYKPILGKKGNELFREASKLIKKTHTERTYASLWQLYGTSGFKDTAIGKEDKILDIYSKNPSGTDEFNYRPFKDQIKGNVTKLGQGYNREHLIPKSTFKKQGPMLTDAHHIFPTDGWVNKIRSNYKHDIVKKETGESKKIPNNAKLGRNKSGEMVFEPDNYFKGDVARAYLYFALRYYQNKNIFTKISVFQKSYPYVKQPFLSVYLDWHENIDPVDQFDLNRNNSTHEFQNNRNPFIDIPYLSKHIWNPEFQNKELMFKQITS